MGDIVKMANATIIRKDGKTSIVLKCSTKIVEKGPKKDCTWTLVGLPDTEDYVLQGFAASMTIKIQGWYRAGKVTEVQEFVCPLGDMPKVNQPPMVRAENAINAMSEDEKKAFLAKLQESLK